jgi:hypothetical protein
MDVPEIFFFDWKNKACLEMMIEEVCPHACFMNRAAISTIGRAGSPSPPLTTND